MSRKFDKIRNISIELKVYLYSAIHTQGHSKILNEKSYNLHFNFEKSLIICGCVIQFFKPKLEVRSQNQIQIKIFCFSIKCFHGKAINPNESLLFGPEF